MAPPGHVVQLAFSSFHLEDSNGCYFDSISVYDGYVNETVGADPTKPIGNFCGSTIPPLILSTGNVLSFIFKTDDSASGDGFAATYNFIDGKHSAWHNIFIIHRTHIVVVLFFFLCSQFAEVNIFRQLAHFGRPTIRNVTHQTKIARGLSLPTMASKSSWLSSISNWKAKAIVFSIRWKSGEWMLTNDI